MRVLQIIQMDEPADSVLLEPEASEIVGSYRFREELVSQYSINRNVHRPPGRVRSITTSRRYPLIVLWAAVARVDV